MMKILSSSILFIIATLCIQCSNFAPEVSHLPAEKIQVGPGPEDMVLDTLRGKARLIISCSARRESQGAYGEMESLDLRTGDQAVLTRYNEPGNVVFRPHGIYLDKDMLFVISHEQEPDYHPILVYRLHGDSLEFRELINSPRQHSPNALVTGPQGEIYLVNDSGKRGSLAEKAFRLKRASVVRLMRNPDGRWESEFMALDLGYPAGINRIGERLYVGDAILHRVHVFKISSKGLLPDTAFKNLRGNDNIRIHDGQLIVTGHIKPLRFIKHAKDPSKLSPVEVFRVDPQTGESTSIYHTDGSAISAGSTALIFENHLYICQVFDPFMLKVTLKE